MMNPANGIPPNPAHAGPPLSGSLPQRPRPRIIPPLTSAWPQVHGRVAQSVEQGIENPCVGGSIPSPATISVVD